MFKRTHASKTTNIGITARSASTIGFLKRHPERKRFIEMAPRKAEL